MNQKKGTVNKDNIFGVLFQFVVTTVVVIFGILSLFHNKYYFAFELSIAIDLLIMAYNNQKVYHKKGLTFVYIGFALILLVSVILSKLGVM